MVLSNKLKKGDVYYGVKLYDNNNKYIGSHNGIRVTKRIQWFYKEFLNIFIDELKEKSQINSVNVVIVEKKF